MIESTTCKIIYTADGSNVYWSVPFAYHSADEVKLYVHDGSSMEEIAPENFIFDTDDNTIEYPVINESNPVSPVPSGYKVVVMRATDKTQEESSALTSFKSNDVEHIADKLTMQVQELSEEIDRCIQYNPVDAISSSTDPQTVINLLEGAESFVTEQVNAATEQAGIASNKAQEAANSASACARDAFTAYQAEITASQQAGIATNKATAAADSATLASGYASNAASSASSAASAAASAVSTHNASNSAHSDIRDAITNAASAAVSSATSTAASDATSKVSSHNSSNTAHSDIRSLIAGKQDTISDLSTIRSGAAAGATAVQPSTLNTALAAKQNTLTAGTNITISGDVISAASTTYTAGNNITISNGQISATDTKYTAGTNISISSGNVISATDTKYTAGTNITIDGNNVISATGSTGASAWGDITGTLSNQTDLQNALNAKQDTLVAGDNIIINGNTISSTGGGSASLNWGNIAGTLSNQTDLQNALDGKQASLSTAQLNAANSGATSAKVTGYDSHVADTDIHVTSSQKSAWSAKQDAISSSNKLSASLVATDSDAQFVSASDKTAWNAKQDAISDINTIRTNATAGAGAASTIAGYGDIVTHNASEFLTEHQDISGKANTADLGAAAFSNSYNDLNDKPTIPTVNNAKLTIQKNGTTVKTFTANASSNVTCNITVPTTAADVGALPDSTTIPSKTSDLQNDSGFITSSSLPTVNNSTITITQGGVTKGSFTLNQSSATTIDVDAGGSGGGSITATYDSTNKILTLE